MSAWRFERKYLLSAAARDHLLARWQGHLVRAPFTDARARYPVLSQYYDSPDLAFYREKLAGDGLRRKVRVRTYGHRFGEGGPWFLEIKHRTQETVHKTRLRLPGARRAHLDPDSWRGLDPAAAGPFVALLETHNLRPTAQVWYVREAYEAAAEPGLRVTFDSSVRALHARARMSRAALYDDAGALLPADRMVLEVKGPEELPAWVRDGIGPLELQQQSVPKYVMAVEALHLVTFLTGVFA